MRLALLTAAALGALGLAACDSGGGRPGCPVGQLCLEYGNEADPLSIDPAMESSVQGDHPLHRAHSIRPGVQAGPRHRHVLGDLA
jgi:hypothetical protein